MKVVLSRQANQDLMAQLDWLGSLSAGPAGEAERAIRTQLRILAEFPAAGVSINALERKWPIPFGRDGFVAVYRIERDRVVIGRIYHGRQARG